MFENVGNLYHFTWLMWSTFSQILKKTSLHKKTFVVGTIPSCAFLSKKAKISEPSLHVDLGRTHSLLDLRRNCSYAERVGRLLRYGASHLAWEFVVPRRRSAESGQYNVQCPE